MAGYNGLPLKHKQTQLIWSPSNRVSNRDIFAIALQEPYG
jgi:hypothetical protein